MDMIVSRLVFFVLICNSLRRYYTESIFNFMQKLERNQSGQLQNTTRKIKLTEFFATKFLMWCGDRSLTDLKRNHRCRTITV